jgi:histidinol-phosphate aminotransferase
MRTLSKLGLAGLRIGLLIGNEAWLEEFNKIRLPYNLNVLSQFTASFILQRKPVLDEQARQIRRDREQLFESLQKLPGVQIWPSRANFLLFRLAKAAEVFARLKAEKVLIKSLTAGHPLLADCLRVTVGTASENQAFLAALGTALAES